jgi:hypothetical protein
MTRDTLIVGGLVVLALSGVTLERLGHRGSHKLALAEACALPVEQPGGVACLRGSHGAVRPGDRIDAMGRPIGRMTPAALETYQVVLDVNRADAAELETLPSIGPALAARIVDARKVARFERVDALLRVPGIGERTLARIRPRVTVE